VSVDIRKNHGNVQHQNPHAVAKMTAKMEKFWVEFWLFRNTLAIFLALIISFRSLFWCVFGTISLNTFSSNSTCTERSQEQPSASHNDHELLGF
jgi:hypothetical protein